MQNTLVLLNTITPTAELVYDLKKEMYAVKMEDKDIEIINLLYFTRFMEEVLAQRDHTTAQPITNPEELQLAWLWWLKGTIQLEIQSLLKSMSTIEQVHLNDSAKAAIVASMKNPV